MTSASSHAGDALGIVCTSDPRASAVGEDIYRAGGNAADAAVAAALTLSVVEPHHCGLGGDAFVTWFGPGDEQPHGLDGSGAIPMELARSATEPDFRRLSLGDPRSITTPGALSLLHTFAQQRGVLGWPVLVEPARRLAAEGFTVRPTLEASIAQVADRLAADPVMSSVFMPGGTALKTGDRLVLPRLAEVLERIAVEGPDVLYRGDVAADIVSTVTARGGLLTLQDLAEHATVPMAPISARFRGHDIWELPSPTHGPAILAALAELDSLQTIADIDMRASIERGLAGIGIEIGSPATKADTSYIAAIDSGGLGVSLITSVFSDFGSCLGVPSLEGPMQNRAAGVNHLGRRPVAGKPPHTILPGLVTRDGELCYSLGVVGGLMQTQGQVQVIVKLLDRGMSLDEAVDSPRFRILAGGQLAIEPGNPLEALEPTGVGRSPGLGGFGSAQVAKWAGGEISGAADARRGGAVGLAVR